MEPVRQVAVVGGGTAGFIAAFALKLKLPRLKVTVIRSPQIGIIGVGEGSTPPFKRFLHDFLGISVQEFVRATGPGLKTGTCFHWGPRSRFFFPLGAHMALRPNNLPKAIGFYFDHGDAEAASLLSARMQANRTFGFIANNSLMVDLDYAYHVENERFAGFLESKAVQAGVEVIDGTIENVSQDDRGISGLALSDSRVISADLYVDCSGFRSLLLGKTLGEPRVDFKSTLTCDRAVVGGWERPAGVPMLSYTQSDTMDAGWCWRIDHPERINRGYVYSSAFISDQAAEQELRNKNPLIGATRVVKFSSGRFARSWVKNVVAIGNASGFVEPLEATSLAVLATRSQLLVELLEGNECVICPPMAALFNQNTAAIWDAVRDFLSLHYRFNTRLSTPFWLDRQANTDMGNAQGLVDFYQHMGPNQSMTGVFVTRAAVFDAHSYLAILVGLRAQTHHAYRPTSNELHAWDAWCNMNARNAQSFATTEQALAILTGGRPAHS
jgi:tryptophan halogenase